MKKRALFLMLIASIGLQAQTTHTVINTNDAGLGSLRAAADSCLVGDTIRFNPSLIANGSDSIVLTSGEIAFGNKGVVVKGLYTNTDTLFISGNQNSRILSFYYTGRIVLDSLVLINGNGQGLYASGAGGAILSYGNFDTLFLTNSTILGNSAINGGGIFGNIISVTNSTIYGNTAGTGGGINAGKVFVSNSNISGNTATGFGGGGIKSVSTVYVTNSIISGNTASYSRGGGGIYCESADVSVTVINATISGNTANGNGGGIYVRSLNANSSSMVTIKNSTLSGNTAIIGVGGGVSSHNYTPSSNPSSFSIVTVINSTISGNSCNGYGGGIQSWSSNSTVNVINSTITGNTAVQFGAGISSHSPLSSIIDLTSSIVAENGANSSGIYNSDSITIISNGYNVFSDTLTGTIGSDSTSVTSAQLNLQTLAFNGGFSQTILPGLGSVALDNGNPNDSSDAQNSPIQGTRNIGAAETCFAIPTSIFVTQCAAYTVPSGNFTYTQSGVYTDTIVTSCGADSLIIINLTSNSIPTTEVITICDSLTWIDGITYYASNTTAKDTLMNAVGCDSIVTLNLTILNLPHLQILSLHVVLFYGLMESPTIKPLTFPLLPFQIVRAVIV